MPYQHEAKTTNSSSLSSSLIPQPLLLAGSAPACVIFTCSLLLHHGILAGCRGIVRLVLSRLNSFINLLPVKKLFTGFLLLNLFMLITLPSCDMSFAGACIAPDVAKAIPSSCSSNPSNIPDQVSSGQKFPVLMLCKTVFKRLFFARCCLGKVPGGAPFSQLHKGIGSITRTGQLMRLYKPKTNSNKTAAATNNCGGREDETDATELIGEMHRMRGVASKVVREAPSRPPRCTGTMK